MILKTAVDDYASVIGADPGWVYYDRIARVHDHREIRVEGDVRISCTRDELRNWVEQAWGIERHFADELWPEYPDERAQRTISCLHLTRDDGSMVLALVAGPTFLMSEDGRTIERVR